MVIKCIGLYIFIVIVIATFMPFLSPTDVLPDGSDGLSDIERFAQGLAIYALPLVIVVVYIRQVKRGGDSS